MNHQNTFERSPSMMLSASRCVLVFFVIGLLASTNGFSGMSMVINNLGSIKLNRALLAYSNEQTMNKDFTSAGLSFQQALTVDRKMGYAYYNLGTIYTHFGDAESAHDQFEMASEVLPADIMCLFQLGMAKSKTGDEYGAITLWQRVDAAPFFVNSSRLSIKNKNFNQALRDAQRAQAINPSSVPAYHALGEIYAQKKAYSDALQAYQTALDLEPNNPISLYRTGRIYDQLDQTEKARIYYQLAISQNPQYISALKSLAELYSRYENCEQAEAVLQELLSSQLMTMHSANAQRIVGTCYLMRQNPEKAVVFLEQLANSETTKSDDYLQLALAYEMLDRIKAATLVYDYVLLIDPGNEPAQTAKSRLSRK